MFVPKTILACASVAFFALLSIGGWFIGEKYGSSRRKHFRDASETIAERTHRRGWWLLRSRFFVSLKNSLWRSLWRDHQPQNHDINDNAKAGTNGHDNDSLAPLSFFNQISQRESTAGEPPDERSPNSTPTRTSSPLLILPLSAHPLALPIRPLPWLPIPGQPRDAVCPTRRRGSRYWSHDRGISVHSHDRNAVFRVDELEDEMVHLTHDTLSV